MQIYLDMLSKIMNEGTDQYNTRTKLNCRTLIGEQIKFDISNNFPAVTTKKLAFKNMKGELLGFFRGYDNAADFRALGCGIWDQNANETPAWLDNPNRKGEDDLGRIYGVNWTGWSDKRVVKAVDVETMKNRGYNVIEYLCKDYTSVMTPNALMERKINQLENALTTILTNPSDRRIIVSGWNVAEFDLMSLPPCHMTYLFIPMEDSKTLHVVMNIRSWDTLLGAPFNIASTALFLEIMAKLSGYKPGTVTIQAANAHIYSNHTEQVREQLNRRPLKLPKLILSDKIKQVSVDEVKGAFERITPEDIWLEGYESYEAIKAPMAV